MYIFYLLFVTGTLYQSYFVMRKVLNFVFYVQIRSLGNINIYDGQYAQKINYDIDHHDLHGCT